MTTYTFLLRHGKIYFGNLGELIGDLAIRYDLGPTSANDAFNQIFVDTGTVQVNSLQLGTVNFPSTGSFTTATKSQFPSTTSSTFSYPTITSAFESDAVPGDPVYPGIPGLVTGAALSVTTTPQAFPSQPCKLLEIYNDGPDDILVGPAGSVDFKIPSGNTNSFQVGNANELSVQCVAGETGASNVYWIAS